MPRETFTKLQTAVRKFMGRDYPQVIRYMIGPKGAFTILMEYVDAIPKDISSFAKLEKFIVLMGIFEEHSLHFLKKAERFYVRKESSDVGACIERLVVLLQRCGLEKYKHKGHKTFVKYDGRIVLLFSPYWNFPESVAFFQEQQKSAKGSHKLIVKDLEWDVQDFLKRKMGILKDDYHRLQLLFPQETKKKQEKKKK
jgi:hypothetical protein